jgi:glycosyltransferase involved in cell wall biosynthesis
MRILHVVPSFGLGGMEKIISAIIESTADQYEHSILSLDGCAHAVVWIKHSNAQFIEFERPPSRRLFFGSLFKALRLSDPELLMTYNWGATDAIWLGRLAGIRKIVHSEHGFNVEEATTTLWMRDCMRFLVYHLSSKVITVSHELEDMLQHRFLLSQDKVKRIPNGVDAFYYSPDDGERQRVRNSLGFRDAECVLGFSGRLDPVKNLNLLLDIFTACKPHETPVRLLIVGDGPEGQRLKSRCHDEGIHPFVVFAGQQQQVLPYLRAMDVFVLTSLREQMPLTVLEAMAVGIPVVATGVGEIPYMIDDGKDGFVRDPNAPVDAFVEPLRSLFCPSQRKRMANAARQKALDRLNHQAMLQDYMSLIDEVN